MCTKSALLSGKFLLSVFAIGWFLWLVLYDPEKLAVTTGYVRVRSSALSLEQTGTNSTGIHFEKHLRLPNLENELTTTGFAGNTRVKTASGGDMPKSDLKGMFHVEGEPHSNRCTWNPKMDSSKIPVHNTGSESCLTLFKYILTDTVSSVLFLGDSTMSRTFSSTSEYKCSCQSILQTSRCDLIEKFGMKRASKWNPPILHKEGPLSFGKKHPFCTDCSGCPSSICVGANRTRKCIEESYISVEFAKDVEMQSDASNTTQETVALYLKKKPRTDLCIVAAGLHDMAIPGISDTQYGKNLKWYLNLLQPHCSRMIYIGQTSVMGDPRYKQTNPRIKAWNSITSALISNMNFTLFVDVYESSINGKHVDNTHMHAHYYRALKRMIFKYFHSNNQQR